MQHLRANSKTIIFPTNRIEFVGSCDQVVLMENGAITYQVIGCVESTDMYAECTGNFGEEGVRLQPQSICVSRSVETVRQYGDDGFCIVG